jgi:tetratricopeptide (TPR) repeat protein
MVEALDLKGKIYAQQGKYDQAIEAWQQVLTHAPNHEGALKAIEKAKQLKEIPMNKFYLRANLYYVGLFLIILALAFASVFFWGKSRGGHYDTLLQTLVETQQGQMKLTQSTLETLTASAAKSETAATKAFEKLEQRMAQLTELQGVHQAEAKGQSKGIQQLSTDLQTTAIQMEGLRQELDTLQQNYDESLENLRQAIPQPQQIGGGGVTTPLLKTK